MTAVSVSTGRPAKCGSCGAPIVWCRTITGKASPMEQADDGTWILVDGVMHRAKPEDAVRFKSHFSSCPQAGSWRRKK